MSVGRTAVGHHRVAQAVGLQAVGVHAPTTMPVSKLFPTGHRTPVQVPHLTVQVIQQKWRAAQ